MKNIKIDVELSINLMSKSWFYQKFRWHFTSSR